MKTVKNGPLRSVRSRCSLSPTASTPLGWQTKWVEIRLFENGDGWPVVNDIVDFLDDTRPITRIANGGIEQSVVMARDIDVCHGIALNLDSSVDRLFSSLNRYVH